MAEQVHEVIGYGGVDTVTDPFILGKTKPHVSVLSYNYRSKNGIKISRGGYQSVIDLSQSNTGTQATGRFRKSGIYFPDGAKAILPHTAIDFTDTFYLAGQGALSIEFWMKTPF